MKKEEEEAEDRGKTDKQVTESSAFNPMREMLHVVWCAFIELDFHHIASHPHNATTDHCECSENVLRTEKSKTKKCVYIHIDRRAHCTHTETVCIWRTRIHARIQVDEWMNFIRYPYILVVCSSTPVCRLHFVYAFRALTHSLCRSRAHSLSPCVCMCHISTNVRYVIAQQLVIINTSTSFHSPSQQQQNTIIPKRAYTQCTHLFIFRIGGIRVSLFARRTLRTM